MSRRRPSQLKKQAIELAGRPALNFFELARLISMLHDRDPISLRNFPKESGMGRRRLYYLLGVGRLIEAHTITKPDAEEVGWTKLQIIARHVTRTGGASAKDIRMFLNMATKTKAHSLAEVLRGEDAVATRAVMFHLGSDDRVELNYALVAFGAETTHRGLARKEAALVILVKAAMNQRS